MNIEPFEQLQRRGINTGRGPDLDMPGTTERIWAEGGGNAIEAIADRATGTLYRVLWRVKGGPWQSQANPQAHDIARLLRALFMTLFAMLLTACQFLDVMTLQPVNALQAPTATQLPRQTAQPTNTTQPTMTPPACVVIASDALNMRGGPGLSYGVIAWLKPGERLTILQTRGAWLEVQTDQGARGWINSNYCKGK